MKYFDSDFNAFFIELAGNNHKEWFDQNRDRYHQKIKAPFEKFVQALIERVKVFEPCLEMKYSQAIFRINRDIRFAKDKSPYKLNRSAYVSKYGRKDASHPALYVELGPERVYIAGGAYQPEKEHLQLIREAIASDNKGWKAAVSDKGFRKYFGEVKGEENKRLPDADLTSAAAIQPDIFKKQFYYQAQLSPNLVTSDDLIEKIMVHYESAQPVHAFLEKAISRS